jgi:hypothetical protein
MILITSDPDPLVRGTDPGIRISTKTSRIPYTGFLTVQGKRTRTVLQHGVWRTDQEHSATRVRLQDLQRRLHASQW